MITQVKKGYAEIYEWENLYWAYRKAAKGKRSQRPAAEFEFRLEDNLITLRDELSSESYQPGEYVNFTIHEPKRRLISAAPFRDRVVHHALCNVIEPAFERSFIYHSYANREGKGNHKAVDMCQRWMARYRYVLPCDVKQFFPSIDHQILQRTLFRRIQDGQTRQLIQLILDSGLGVLREQYDMVYFVGDNLLAATRPRGLPIGNLTSQFWANCYMNEVDHFVTRTLSCGAYIRFVDDMLLFGNDKATLWRQRAALIERLAGLRLTLHEAQAQVRPTSEGVRFLGFYIYPEYRRLLRRKGVYYQRTIRKMQAMHDLGKLSSAEYTSSLQGWLNHVRYGDTWGLRSALLKPVRIRKSIN